MEREQKFKVDDIVKHKASPDFNPVKMLVKSTGTLTNETGTRNVYELSAQVSISGFSDKHFVRIILEEDELELVPVKEKKSNASL